MEIINNNLINNLINKARESNRKRKNYNFHKDASDTFQRMLHALEPDTYVQPHKHENPDKREVFIIITGEAVVVEFDDLGNVLNHYFLNREKGLFGIEIPEKKFHTLIATQSGTVVYEAKDGPYNPSDDKNFASWAPTEGQPETEQYLKNLLQKLEI